MGGGWKEFLGFGKAGGSQLQSAITAGSGFTGNLAKLGKSNAALMGGAMLAMDGIRRGGALGMVETTAGGAMIGFKYGGGVGAAIGAAVGAGIGLIGLFRKSAEKKAAEKIKAVYGVDIKDKGVLKQIIEIAKDRYGSNLDMAIRTAEVRDLVRLFAMSTGQSIAGLPKTMTSSTLVQSGGVLSQERSYYGGVRLPDLGGRIPTYHRGTPYVPRDQFAFLQRGEAVIPSKANPFAQLAGRAAAAFSININSAPINISGVQDPDALKAEIVSLVEDNHRAIQAAVIRASKGNYGRRELTALNLQPGTLTS
jgi:hypothetical protein